MKKSPNPGAASSSKPAKPAAKKAVKVKTRPPADAETVKKAAPVAKSAAKKAVPVAKNAVKKTAPAAKNAAKKAVPAAGIKTKKAAPAAKPVVKKSPLAEKTAVTKAVPAEQSVANKAQVATAAPNGKESFFEEVFRLVRMVPKGRVTSYGDIANAAEARITARMVGWAMHAAGSAKPPVPAHRVVNSSGVLSGRQAFPTPTLMQELLEQEGVKVKNDKVQNFSKLRWAFPPAKSKDMPVIKGAK